MTTAEDTGYAFKGGNVARWQRDRGNPIQRTPDALFRKLDAEFGFTLDAAASHVNAKCQRYFTVDDDALGRDWGTERVWLNPPFGKGLREWARKAWEASRNGALVVMLVPSATDMDWWHDYILEADELRFIRGRASFGSEDLTRSNYVFPISIAVFRPTSTGERVEPAAMTRLGLSHPPKVLASLHSLRCAGPSDCSCVPTYVVGTEGERAIEQMSDNGPAEVAAELHRLESRAAGSGGLPPIGPASARPTGGRP